MLLTDEERKVAWVDGVVNYEDATEAVAKAQLKKVVEDIGTYRFAEPIQVPEYGREPIIICIPLEDWQALLEVVK